MNMASVCVTNVFSDHKGTLIDRKKLIIHYIMIICSGDWNLSESIKHLAAKTLHNPFVKLSSHICATDLNKEQKELDDRRP
ncbi:hypothetical protein XENTR_v10021720 [Xenopus tropicalis]|nr:hypothetical protein XENTR_v10021720 [Xenopus tropicalis]